MALHSLDLFPLYSTRLKQLGMSECVHSTKLKNRIRSCFPDMNAHKQGHDVVLVCNDDVGAALRKACEYDADNDAVRLARDEAGLLVVHLMPSVLGEVSTSFTVDTSSHDIVWSKHHKPVKFCIYASNSSQSFSASYV